MDRMAFRNYGGEFLTESLNLLSGTKIIRTIEISLGKEDPSDWNWLWDYDPIDDSIQGFHDLFDPQGMVLKSIKTLNGAILICSGEIDGLDIAELEDVDKLKLEEARSRLKLQRKTRSRMLRRKNRGRPRSITG